MEARADTRSRGAASTLTGSATKRTLAAAARKFHPISAAAVAALGCLQVYGLSRQLTRTREDEMGTTAELTTITEHELYQVDRANASAATPVVFVHGLWLLPSSWDRWAALFEEAGYVAVTPGWPADPETVGEAHAHPEVFAGKGIGQIADYEESIIRRLDRRPVVIGHSFGGLLTEILAGRGLSAASVAISPAPFRGVLPLPISALRAGSPVLGNPRNRHRAVPLTYDQFRYAFANAVSEDEAKTLYDTFAVPASGKPLFQAASANLNPWTEAKVATKNPARGPLLIIDGEKDNTVPWAIANASFKRQQRNEGVTEIVKIPNRGHSLTIDGGWREVADTTLQFVQRFVKP
jgi:pimeloyl-ACP methyl ester carboxylesterase